MHDAELGRSLVTIARRAIGTALGEAASVRPERAEPAHPALEAPGATFVTLFKDGMLRGCIGSIEAQAAAGHRRARQCGRGGVRRSTFSAPGCRRVQRTRRWRFRFALSTRAP